MIYMTIAALIFGTTHAALVFFGLYGFYCYLFPGQLPGGSDLFSISLTTATFFVVKVIYLLANYRENMAIASATSKFAENMARFSSASDRPKDSDENKPGPPIGFLSD